MSALDRAMPPLRCFPGWRLGATAVLVALFGVLATSAVRAQDDGWLEIDSDLPMDPALRIGVLENGVRYAVMPHAFPPDRVSMRLLVAVGSRDERDEERGMAHYLEHMAFRGTAAYPRGSLAPALARLGMAPGPDSTAFTSYDHTIYHLELPGSSAELLDTGLAVFREFATSITFDPNLIDLERPVILNEKSIRNTPQARELEGNRTFLFPTAREARRNPIGLALTVGRFQREDFVRFYDAWYRPERLGIIVAGDVDADAVVERIRESFGSVEARAPAPETPTDLVTRQLTTSRFGLHREEGIPGIAFVLQRAEYRPREPFTRETRRQALLRALGFDLFQRRMGQIARRPESALASPDAGISNPVRDWELRSFEASGGIDNWRELLAEMELELRRALEHGFTAEELRQSKAGFRAFYQELALTADTRESYQLAGELVGVLLQGAPFATPATIRDEYLPLVEAATLEDCFEAFREAWGAGPSHVFIGTHPAFSAEAVEVERVLAESATRAVEPPEEREAVAFAYTEFGDAGTLRRQQHLEDLDVRISEFENRVRLNFKRTEFDRGFVGVNLRVGSGLRSMPVRGLNYFANAAFSGGGLGRHPASELQGIFAGRNISMGFSVQGDAFEFSARTSREDLLFCLQVMAAYLTDPGFRPEGLGDARASIGSMYQSLATSPGGDILANLEFVLSGGDGRFGVPDAVQVYGRSHEELRAWLQPQFSDGPVEVAIVGDVPWEDVREAMAATLGALPARGPMEPAPNRSVRFPADNPVMHLPSGSSVQASFALAFPVPDMVDIRVGRRLAFLADVLNENLRVALREELGATYTLSVRFVHHDGFEGLSYLLVTADVLPAHLDRLPGILLAQVNRLRNQGIDADLFERVRQPYLRAREDSKRTNGYWLGTVLSAAQQYPEDLAAARDRDADSAAITAAELQALAQRYLEPPAAFVFVAEPAAANPAPAR